MLFVFMDLSFANTNKNLNEVRISQLPKEGYVPDENTAVKIAEALLIPLYGERRVKNLKPFNAILMDDEIWLVSNTLAKRSVGGTLNVQINKKDCKVIDIYETR